VGSKQKKPGSRLAPSTAPRGEENPEWKKKLKRRPPRKKKNRSGKQTHKEKNRTRGLEKGLDGAQKLEH